MNFTFNVYSVEDAVLTRAACDGIIQASTQQKFATLAAMYGSGPKEEHVTDSGAAASVMTSGYLSVLGTQITDTASVSGDMPVITNQPEPEAAQVDEPEETDEGDTAGYSKAQIKEAAGQNPELAALASKRGKKSAEIKARIQELTHAYFCLQTKATAPANPLSGMSAEQLNETLKSAGTEVAAAAQQVSGLAAMDPDLAAIAAAHTPAAPEPEPAKEQNADPATMSREELTDKITELADSGYGLWWYKNVIAQGGGDVNKMPLEHMKQVLANPEAYHPQK